MALDNVTLFEITIEEFPFGTEDDGAGAEGVPADADADDSGGRGLQLLGLLLGGVALAAAAYWVSRRGGDEGFETEAVEPGVERVEA